ncbi:MAG: GIY-YIG nuclease family protein [Candidatus Cloacimonadales bacterium]|nr:GIY-YIG nuclease family protein [Candidatus Cloacimonadales bacterium]
MSKTYWVYILKCSDGSYYTGSTSEIETRLSEHQNGSINGYTSKCLPVKLVFSDYFENAYDAVSAERQIKGWTRAKKEALINGNFDLLHELAQCKNETNFKRYEKNENQT